MTRALSGGARELLKTINHYSYAARETKDCTVKALAITTGYDYAKAWAAMKFAGRRDRKGAHISITRQAAERLGFNMVLLRRRGYYRDCAKAPRKWTAGDYTAKTAITAERDRQLQAGNYIISYSGHLAGMVDGEIIDWSRNRKKRIRGIYRVERIQKAVATDEHEIKCDDVGRYSQRSLF